MPSFPIQLKRNGTAAATPSSLLHGEVALNYADGKLFWKDASNVIQSFTFQAYALSSHTHAASAITSGTLDAARLPLATTIAAGAVIVGTGLGVSSGTVSVTYGTSAGTACQGNDSRLSDARTPTSHSHGNITNAGAIGSTANLPIITTTSGVLTTGSFGTTAATFCEGNDSRLSDTRTPTDGSVTTAKIASAAVTYAKIQNVSATDKLLGRATAGAGSIEEISCGSFGRSLIGSADAAAARTTLSVQPTASPAFTGNATITASSGIPLTLNGNSTALRIEEGSGETIDIYRAASDGLLYLDANQQTFSGFVFRTTPTGGSITSALMIGSSQRVTLYNQLLVTAGSGSSGSYKPGVAVSGDDDTGLQQVGGANTISLVTAGSERVRVDASGNVGVGASSPSSLTPRLHISSAYSAATASTPYNGVFIASSDAQAANTGGVLSLGGLYDASSGPTRFAAIAGLKENGTSGEFGGYLAFYTRANGSTPAERVRVKATGAVRFVPLSADPSTGNEAGDVYYNSSTNKLRVYNGTSWVDLH